MHLKFPLEDPSALCGLITQHSAKMHKVMHSMLICMLVKLIILSLSMCAFRLQGSQGSG